jgi:hypothetical protein
MHFFDLFEPILQSNDASLLCGFHVVASTHVAFEALFLSGAPSHRLVGVPVTRVLAYPFSPMLQRATSMYALGRSFMELFPGA